jgi:hypothetical protein
MTAIFVTHATRKRQSCWQTVLRCCLTVCFTSLTGLVHLMSARAVPQDCPLLPQRKLSAWQKRGEAHCLWGSILQSAAVGAPGWRVSADGSARGGADCGHPGRKRHTGASSGCGLHGDVHAACC